MYVSEPAWLSIAYFGEHETTCHKAVALGIWSSQILARTCSIDLGVSQEWTEGTVFTQSSVCFKAYNVYVTKLPKVPI